MSVVAFKPKKIVLYRECPGCSYRVAQVAVDLMRVDLPCPRCDDYMMSQFEPIYGDQDAQEL